MSYLVAQMLFYLLVALLLGVLLGWIVWGKRTVGQAVDRLYQENAGLRRDLEACGEARAVLERRLAEASVVDPQIRVGSGRTPSDSGSISRPTVSEQAVAVERPETVPPEAQPAALIPQSSATRPKKAGKKVAPQKSAAVGTGKPMPMVQPDDLRRIVGIGPVNERLLHGEGVRRFAQIAAWTPADVKHIEEILQFDGRIERERWIEQASLLAAGDEEEFSKRFPSAGSGKNT